MSNETKSTPLDFFACPRCDQPLIEKGEGLYSKGAQTSYPRIDGIPWLFAEPKAALGEWRNRLQFALQSLSYESQRIEKELAEREVMAKTRDRLERLRSANDDQRNLLRTLLNPLGVESLSANYESHLALRTRLPSDQGLNTYYSNIHRDWVWGDEENAASLAEVRAALEESGGEDVGDTIVLGSGAGRLAYDLHQSLGAAHTFAVDFNPLLALIGQRVTTGGSVDLYEFPIAPRSATDLALKQTLSAPEPAREGLTFVLADVLRPPFAKACVDLVVTPWLIDIVSEDTEVFAQRMNQLLKPGGRWLNFGSLTYSHADRSRRYGAEEILDIVKDSGFETTSVRDTTIPYMCSPHSRHGRRETVFTFAATKRENIKSPKRHAALPDWIVLGKDPVPLSQSFSAQAASTRIYAYVMSLIDGKRSIDDMATIFEQQKLMTKQEAAPAIRNFLIRMYEDSQRNPNF